MLINTHRYKSTVGELSWVEAGVWRVEIETPRSFSLFLVRGTYNQAFDKFQRALNAAKL